MSCQQICDDAAAMGQIVDDIQDELDAAMQLKMLLDMECMDCQMQSMSTTTSPQIGIVSTSLSRTKQAETQAVRRGLVGKGVDLHECVDRIDAGAAKPTTVWRELVKISGINQTDKP